VRVNVVDWDAWLAESECKSFGAGYADEQRPNEAGPVTGGDRIELPERDARFGNSLTDDREQPLGVRTTGDLGDDASVLGVKFVLAGDDVREDTRAAAFVGAHDRRGSFVA
jgi:hypothetical protein